MPRPRRDSEILPAKERLENAFWELLAEREYRKITVTDIVREAQVNRNSFYYHFSSLSELADSAILREVQKTTPASTGISDSTEADANDGHDSQEAIKKRWRKHVAKILDSPEECEHINRLALIVSPHGAPELLDSLRDFARLSLISMLQLDAKHLDIKTDLTIEFAVGGVLAILSRWPELQSQFMPEDLAEVDFVALAMGLYMSMSKNDLRNYWSNIFHDDNIQDHSRNTNSTDAPQARPQSGMENNTKSAGK